MRPTRTIIVVILAIVGLSLAMWTHRRGDVDTRPHNTQRRLIADGELPIDDVNRITLEREGLGRIVMEADGVGWKQVSPFLHPLDPFSVRQLIVRALETSMVDTLEEGELTGSLTAGALGLDPPLARVTFEWPGGSATVSCGRLGIAGRAYLQKDGDPRVFVVDQGLHDRAVHMDPREWRQRQLFDYANVDAVSVDLVEGTRRIRLSREGRRWSMVEPARTRLDDAARDDLFQALGRVQSDGFILDQPEDLSRFGLDIPDGSITVTGERVEDRGGDVTRTPVTERLLVGSRIGGSQDRFGMIEGRPCVFRLPGRALSLVFRDPHQMVDPTGSGVVPADVKTVVVRGPDGEFRLERDLERWIAPDAGRTEVPGVSANEFLQMLTGLRASQVQFQAYPHDMEVGSVTLLGYGGRPLDTIRIARDPQTGDWALENGDSVLRIFAPSLKISLAPTDFGLE